MRTQIRFFALCLVAGVSLARVGTGQTAVLQGPAFAVTVTEKGVLWQGPPPGLENIDGPIVHLPRDLTEWAGYRFEDSSGLVEGVAVGREPDHAGRRPVRLESFTVAGDRATTVCSLGPLEITTGFWFHGDPDAVMVAVTLRNRGSERLRGLFYSREWRVAAGAGYSFPDEYPMLGALPDDVVRMVWMLDDIMPGRAASRLFSFRPPQSQPAQLIVSEVPLEYWVTPTFPLGLPIGCTNGVSFYDYDRDGFPDLLAPWSGELWRNLGGANWQLVADIDSVIPAAYRYGAVFGDYDKDGLADIATEPRTFGVDSCMHLLRNLGGGPNFQDVATDPAVIAQPCMIDAETNCFADVDGDGELDLFVPTYPAWALIGGPGNFFYHNLGPVGPNGKYVFAELSQQAGLDNPPLSARPEGAQFADTDQDGDPDLYSNGTLYQNCSTPGSPLFKPLTESTSGVLYSTALEEGAAFFDYDMDGDLDLALSFDTMEGNKLFENRGDGSFFEAESTIIDAWQFGIGLGLSVVDWDNDGDIDLQTRSLFRRNQLQETGQRKFTLTANNLQIAHIGQATPAWADFDRDGDLDTVIGNWTLTGHYYENVLYGPSTPLADRRYVRVKPVRPSASVAGGLEVEYGARVELFVHGESLARRRVLFTASSAGYVTQNEYTLSFALPADPSPGNPAQDVTFDLVVTFPGASGQGLVRVDSRINPRLGNLHLPDITNREVVVYRDGRVKVGNCDLTPATAPTARATGGGVVLATPTTSLTAPAPTLTPGRGVGIEIDTLQATAPVRVVELVLDGELAAPITCGGDTFNVQVLDVTAGGLGVPLTATRLNLVTPDRNHRTVYPVDWLLPPGRVLRVFAFQDTLRATPVAAPIVQAGVNLRGGIEFAELITCLNLAASTAPVDPGKAWLALRCREEPSPWIDLGSAKAGSTGVPQFAGSGLLDTGSTISLALTGARPNAPLVMVWGLKPLCLPILFSARLVPSVDLLLTGLSTNGAGAFAFATAVPAGLPPGTAIYTQCIIQDNLAAGGLALSNALGITSER